MSPDPLPLIIPSRTIDLESFQRPQNRRRNGGKVILPRVPDVTVTSAVLEVAVNGGSTTTQIAAPTTDIAVTLTDLGTVTIPAVPSTTASAITSPGVSSSRSSDSKPASIDETTLIPTSIVTSLNRNSTTFSASGNTVTIFATSTLHVSYDNGSFLPITTTKKSTSTKSASQNDSDTDTDTGTDSDTRIGSTSGSKSTSRHSFQTTGKGATATGSDSSYYNNNNNAALGATGTSTGVNTQPTSSSGTDSGAAPPILSPQQTRMVGGVVGGIAGVAMILIVLLYVLRWYRERLKKQGRLPRQLASSHSSREFGVAGLVGCAAPMSQSRTALCPVAAGPTMKRWQPGSDVTTLTNATSSSGGGSERGFQRVSGRKIPSVLTTGGDQFGDSYGAFEKESGTLFRTTTTNPYYSDTESAHGFTPPHRPASRSAPSTPVYPAVFASETTALRSPTATSPRPFGADEFRNAFGRNVTKPDGIAVFHSSPARTPVMQSPNTSTLRLPSQAPVTMDEDIPEMPLPSPGLSGMGLHNIGIAIGTGVGERRIPSGTLSARSGTGTGRFREDM